MSLTLALGDHVRVDHRRAVQRRRSHRATRVLKKVPGTATIFRKTAGGLSEVSRVFGPVTLVVAKGTLLYTALNDSPTIEVWDTAGSLVKRLTVDLPEERVTDEDRERYVQGQLAILDGTGKRLRHHEAALRSALFADKFAYFPEMVIADDGAVWVGRMRLTSDRRQYLVFSNAGKLIATTEIPARLKLIDVGATDVLVKTQFTDEDEVVKVLPIRRPE